jgi:hypothetical protein
MTGGTAGVKPTGTDDVAGTMGAEEAGGTTVAGVLFCGDVSEAAAAGG